MVDKSAIKDHTQVVASCGTHVGVVDHLDGERIIKHSTAPLARHCILHGNYCPSFLIMQGFSSFRVAVADRLLPLAARGHIQNGTEPAMMLVVGERILRYTRI